MKTSTLKNEMLSLGLVALAGFLLGSVGPAAAEKPEISLPSGGLQIVTEDGRPAGVCPLKRTEVQTDIVGFVARTTVRQVFHNPLDHKIEAVYIFPLPQDSAVDKMLMVVGGRKVVGQIRERGEARQIYEDARAAGHVASLLDQERSNVFTQSVANIEPGAQVEIEIGFVETLKYEDGTFEWVFPMVVGPRYVPGGGSAPAPMTQGRATAQVPDAGRITPPVVPEGARAGHDVSIRVNIEAGTEIFDLQSVLHEVEVVQAGRSTAEVTLANKATIPNKDFILRYRLATNKIGQSFLTHREERGEFFTLILQPPRRVAPTHVVARELIFVLDTSGSMRGFPMAKSRELMGHMIETMQGADTFNIITFAGQTHLLWEQPRPNTARNRTEAQDFLDKLRGSGGTEMMKAIRTALVQDEFAEQDRMRIVCFMTDGYVGNDMAIIDQVRRNAATTRVFSFGIGNSVNRYLLDGMAHAGRGGVEYVTLESQGDDAVQRFHQRVLAPVLTDIEIDWGKLPVAEVFPRRVPDLFAAQPIMVHGRLEGPGSGEIVLRGRTGAGLLEHRVRIDPRKASGSEALASLWARAKVADLTNQDLSALQRGSFPQPLKDQIISLGIRHSLMTPFTSFVAVEEMIVTVGGQPTRVEVPVEMPEGVSHQGVFGRPSGLLLAGSASGMVKHKYMMPPPPSARALTERVTVASASRARQGAPTEPKLAEPLRDLANKVRESGKSGTLTIDGIQVRDFEIDVMIFLEDVSESTLLALKELGFVTTGESKTTRMLTGRIDVRKLDELAALETVVSVRPVRA